MSATSAVAVAGAACCSSLASTACDSREDASATAPTTADADADHAAAAPAPDCGDPVASFAPDGRARARPDAGRVVHGEDPAARPAHRRRVGRHAAVRLPQPVHRQARRLRHRHGPPRSRRRSSATRTGSSSGSMTYAQRIPALQDGSVDIVADVMTINCTRWEQIYFSSQYFDAGQKVLVRTDSHGHGHRRPERQEDVRRQGLDELRQHEELPEGDPGPGRRHLRLHGAVPAGRGRRGHRRRHRARRLRRPGPVREGRRRRRSRASRTGSASPRRIPSSCGS